MAAAIPKSYSAKDYLPHMGVITDAQQLPPTYRYEGSAREVNASDYARYAIQPMEGYTVTLIDEVILVRDLSNEMRHEIQKTAKIKKSSSLKTYLGIACLMQGFVTIPGLMIWSVITGNRLRGGTLSHVVAIVACIFLGVYIMGNRQSPSDVARILAKKPVSHAIESREFGIHTPVRVLKSENHYPYFHPLELLSFLQRIITISDINLKEHKAEQVANTILTYNEILTKVPLRERLETLNRADVKEIFSRWDELDLLNAATSSKSKMQDIVIIIDRLSHLTL